MTNYWIDTHCHLDSSSSNIGVLIKEATKAGVNKLISVGTDVGSSKESLRLAKEYSEVFSAVGVHPADIRKASLKEVLETYKTMVGEEVVVAVGEIGLDAKCDIPIKEQGHFFEAMLEFAKEVDIPVIIHCRNAWREVREVVSSIDIQGVFHCFTGSYDDAKWAIDRGFKLGIGGIITYPNAGDLRKVVRKVGVAHIVLETDAPLLAPQQHRGEVNKPAYIPLIGENIAEVVDKSIDGVKEITTNNTNKTFAV